MIERHPLAWPSGLHSETTVTETAQLAPTQLLDPQLESDIRRLSELRHARVLIEEEIQRILGRVRNPLDPDADRPTWGPCTRCGHVWRGLWANRPPIGCPRCGSSGWQHPPRKAGSRTPSDPPRKSWGKNRRTGRPADPENVLGRKDRMLKATQAPATPDRELMNVKPASVAPPPRIADVAQATSSMVPPPQVRFAEPRPEPQPESFARSGTSSVAERDASIVDDAGSIPVSRSNPDVLSPWEMDMILNVVEFASVETDGTIHAEEDEE